jgi:hypothetical protein
MRIMTSIVACAWVAAITAQSPAQFVIDSAWRNVRVNYSSGQPIVSIVSTDLGSFLQTAAPPESGFSATQNSVISSTQIFGSLQANLPQGPPSFFPQSASSALTAVFHVERPTLFILAGSAFGGAAGQSGGSYRFMGGSIDYTVNSLTQPGSQQLPGLLMPGVSYTLSATARAADGSSFTRYGGQTGIQLATFSPSSPQQRACDVTRAYGEAVGLVHISIAIATWGQTVSPGTEGDYNYDGVVNLSDISRVLEVWTDTCAP